MVTTWTRTLVAGILPVAWLGLGCNGTSPSGPSPTSAPLTLRAIEPISGVPHGATVVTISGSGFQAGATVTLGGAATNVTVNGSTTIVATTPAHAPGAVDVVVTNPNGQSGRLAAGFLYAQAPPVPGPVVTAITPNVGSTGGGSPVTVTGTGFRGTGYHPGVVVRLGDAVIEAFYANTTTLWLEVPPHAAGQVDVVVTNSDGQSATLAGGYTFVLPRLLDFNGTWLGGHDEPPIRFAIQNDTLISVGCGGSATVTLSPPIPVSNGEFSFSREDGFAVSGRILSASAAKGTINLAPCLATTWYAEKQ